MKRTPRFLSVFVLAVLLALTLVTPVYAFDGRGGDKVVIAAGEVIILGCVWHTFLERCGAPHGQNGRWFLWIHSGYCAGRNVGLFRLRWVLKTVDITAIPGCANLPIAVAPIAGICYAMKMGDTPIYSGPNTTSALVTTMHLNDYAMVTARNAGWLTLDLNVASPSMDTLGDLEESNLGGLNGPCSGL